MLKVEEKRYTNVMAIDSITLVRKRIGDDKKSETESFPLTDTTTTVQLKYGNVGIYNIYDRNVQDTPLEVNTHYTVNVPTGTITLLYTPADTAINMTVVYYYYAFSEEEMTDLIGAYGVNGACVEAIRWLIADSARLHDYSRGATSESLSQITKNLQDMLKDYTKLGVSEDGMGTGGVVVAKRIHDMYRTTTAVPFDLSRDDSLST